MRAEKERAVEEERARESSVAVAIASLVDLPKSISAAIVSYFTSADSTSEADLQKSLIPTQSPHQVL